MNYISIFREFTKNPGPRLKIQGQFSGEEFLQTILEKKYLKSKNEGVQLMVNLDGAIGYASGFLDESFGALARKYGADKVLSVLKLHCLDEPSLIDEIHGYITGRI